MLLPLRDQRNEPADNNQCTGRLASEYPLFYRQLGPFDAGNTTGIAGWHVPLDFCGGETTPQRN